MSEVHEQQSVLPPPKLIERGLQVVLVAVSVIVPPPLQPGPVLVQVTVICQTPETQHRSNLVTRLQPPAECVLNPLQQPVPLW